MSYIYDKPCPFGSNRSEKKIDLPRFAADLAKELKGELQPAGEYPAERQQIAIGADLLEVYADSWKKRVNASISAPDVKWGDWSTYDKAQKCESASINPEARSIAAIAKDIRKRVIDANQPALAARRAYAAKQEQNRADILKHVDAMKAAHPELEVRGDVQKQSAVIYSRSSGHYIAASMDCNGNVNIERIGAVKADKFSQIMAVLNGK
jgi:hypothetical protein